MGRLFLVELDKRFYSCTTCEVVHLALYSDRISKDLQLGNREAYFFENVVNVTTGEAEERMLSIGRFTVSDIFCVKCGTLIGLKLVTAFQNNQKYRENRFAVERNKLIGHYKVFYNALQDTDDEDDSL